MTETEKRIEELRDRVAEAGSREKAAEIEKHRALAELAEIRGDEEEREYHLAYIAAQTHAPGGHARFMSHCWRRDAAEILAGRAKLDDFIGYERTHIADEIERMKASPAPGTSPGPTNAGAT